MEVVIDIPEEYREAFKKNRCEEQFDSLCTNEFGYELRKAFENGVVLPKGHGDLIDRSKIEWYGCDFESDNNCKIAKHDCSACYFGQCSHDQVIRLSAVVPAYKEDAK